MKKISLLFLLAAAVIFCFDAAAACSGKSVRKKSVSFSSSNKKYSYRELAARAKTLRKRENYALERIQYCQQRLFKERNKRKQKNQQRYREEIVRRQREMGGALLQMKDFPFAKNMLDLNTVVTNIQAGRIQFYDCAGKSEEKILREIHKRQWRALQKFQQKRSVIK